MEKRRHKYVRGGKATLAIKFETEANLQDFAEGEVPDAIRLRILREAREAGVT